MVTPRRSADDKVGARLQHAMHFRGPPFGPLLKTPQACGRVVVIDLAWREGWRAMPTVDVRIVRNELRRDSFTRMHQFPLRTGSRLERVPLPAHEADSVGRIRHARIDRRLGDRRQHGEQIPVMDHGRPFPRVAVSM